jgi:glycosyltransferase involved in cell wall biosynthesis
VVLNGVDPEHFRPTSTPRVPGRLLFLGSLDYAPNVEALERLLNGILPRLHATCRDVHLQVVGARPTPAVRSIVEAANQGESVPVELLGEVEDVRPYLAQASLSVVPLGAGGGSRLKIVEALAAGCPVVSTSVGAEGLDLVDGEHICLADGDATFAAALTRLLADSALAQKQANAGREQVLNNNTWSALGKLLEGAWRSASIASV